MPMSIILLGTTFVSQWGCLEFQKFAIGKIAEVKTLFAKDCSKCQTFVAYAMGMT